MSELDYEFINIQVMDCNWEKYLDLPRDQRKDPDFSKIKFDLKIGTKIGIVWKSDKEYYDEWADDESWDDFKLSQCDRALVVPNSNVDAREEINPSEAILCFYDYPSEKENPTTDFITANKVFMNEDIYEVFEL